MGSGDISYKEAYDMAKYGNSRPLDSLITRYKVINAVKSNDPYNAPRWYELEKGKRKNENQERMQNAENAVIDFIKKYYHNPVDVHDWVSYGDYVDAPKEIIPSPGNWEDIIDAEGYLPYLYNQHKTNPWNSKDIREAPDKKKGYTKGYAKNADLNAKARK